MADAVDRSSVLPFPSRSKPRRTKRVGATLDNLVHLHVAPAQTPEPISASVARVVVLVANAMQGMSDKEAESFADYMSRAAPAARGLAMEA